MKKDASGPQLEAHQGNRSAVAAVAQRAAESPDTALAAVRQGNHFIDRSCATVWARVRGLAKGLIASGVAPGDRVALMASTRLEWLEIDLAINAVGAVTVPIYDTSSASQISWIMEDSGSVLLIVETDVLEVEAKASGEVDECREILVIDRGDLDDLAHRGSQVADERLDALVDSIRPESIATIIYTSGTTGRPKGCVLTHRNLAVNVYQVGDALAGAIGPADTALLFLPLAHVLTKTTALFCLGAGVRIAFATSLAKLPEEFALVNPSLISAVPRIFEKVYAKAQQKALADGKGRIFDRAAQTAIHWSQQREAGSIRLTTKAEHWIFDRLVYRKIAAAFGGELRMAFSGGGPLGERLTWFFDGVGLRIYEGYGLTETSPILTISRTDGWRPGSVGRAVAGTRIRVAEDGELLVKGPQVFGEYWKNAAATDEAFDSDGWFLTGDVGEVDAADFVHITGRKKELIVTAAGKNVAPAPLEDRIRSDALVSQVVVVGDRRPFIAALVSIDEDAFVDWSAGHGLAGATVAESTENQLLRAEVQGAIDEANRSVSTAESIRAFAITPRDFALDRDEITPTLKIRRMVVEDHYRDLIESIYAG